MPDPDSDLVPALQAGTPAALSALMDRHLARIHALAWYMLGDTHEAEDVAQETFLRFWQAAPRWKADGPARISTWLHRVASRQCIDRRRRKRPIYTDRLPEREDTSSAPDTQLLQRESGDEVRAALNDLVPRQRAAIVLSFYQELSQAEASEILGVSQKAYESLLVRAKRTLRTRLASQTVELDT